MTHLVLAPKEIFQNEIICSFTRRKENYAFVMAVDLDISLFMEFIII